MRAEHGPEIGGGGQEDRSRRSHARGSVPFQTALDRFLAKADRYALNEVHVLLLSSVLHRAMSAMAPALSELAEHLIDAGGFITQDDLRVRPASSLEAHGPALVVEQGGDAYLFCTNLRCSSGSRRSAARPARTDASMEAPTWDGDADDRLVSSYPGPHVVCMWICRLVHTAEGPSPLLLYELETPTEPSTFDWQVLQQAATVKDTSRGFAPFRMLRAAFSASGFLDAVRERAVEIGRTNVLPMKGEWHSHLVELSRQIALLDEGIPGPSMTERLMHVFSQVAAVILRPTVSAMPELVDGLVAGGHVSRRVAFGQDDAIQAYVVPSTGGVELHLECDVDWFRIGIAFDPDGSIEHLALARSKHANPLHVSGRVGVRDHQMGCYRVRDGLVVPDGPHPEDLDLTRQMTFVSALVRSVSEGLQRAHAFSP